VSGIMADEKSRDAHGGENRNEDPQAGGGSLLSKPAQLLHATDRLQQRSPVLAVAVATWKKFSDNQAGNLAALIAYYAFASLFPLLLVAYSILDIISRRNPKLGKQLTTALQHYPVIGMHLGGTTSQGLGKSGFALVIGILLTLYAGRGVAVSMQNAMNTLWEVPKFRRPGFPKNLLRSLGLIAVLGPGEIVTIALSSIAGGTGHLGGVLAKVAAFVVALLLNIVLFWLGFRIATSKEVSGRDMRPSAVMAAIAWQILQLIGGTFVQHATNSAYGVFGVVLGLLAWFYLQAQITLYVVELDVVRSRGLWPRSLAPPPLTEADIRAYQTYAQTGLLRPELAVDVREEAPPPPSRPRPAEPH
jgi:inner membrane protein YhjD